MKVEMFGGHFMLCDDEDFAMLSQHTWTIARRGGTMYAQRMLRRGGPGVYAHREILGLSDRRVVDHIDRNGLNNVRANLRVATRSQNAMNCGPRTTNKSGYKGVSWDKTRSKWTAHIALSGKSKALGRFDTAVAAAAAYDAAAMALYGEFGCLNFPDDSAREAAGLPVRRSA